MEHQVNNVIDNYISDYSEEIQARLQEVRQIIKNVVSEAEEKISYGIPTFTLNKINLVHFAAYSNHIGFYPTPLASDQFKEQLSKYKCGKGSIQFPHNQQLPLDLIVEIVRFRKEEILNKGQRITKAVF